MKKLVLEDIRVDSFSTGEATQLRGTVQAREFSGEQVCRPGPISQTCASDVTWLQGPVCCALY